jgi:hypothetical protein
MAGHPARKMIWTRETIRSIAVALGVSIIPFLLLNLWICWRAEDHFHCVRQSVPYWAAALFLVVGLLGLQVIWKVVTWASDLRGHPQLRLAKAALLVACAAGPLLLMARPDLDYGAIMRSVASPWFVGFMVLVGYLSWAWASTSPFNPVKTWFSVYAVIIVLMWLGSKGVFHDADDLVADEPPSLPERELLLRNVVFYSVAAFVGIYGRWRLRGERLSRRDVDSPPKRG